MKQRIVTNLIAFLALLVGADVALAQAPGRYPPNYGPGYRPQLSPYLYLAPSGGTNGVAGLDPAIRYYLGTQTEFDRRANYAQSRMEFKDIEGKLATEKDAGSMADDADLYRPLASTGHATAFGNTGSYFGTGYPRMNSQTNSQRGRQQGSGTASQSTANSGRRQ